MKKLLLGLGLVVCALGCAGQTDTVDLHYNGLLIVVDTSMIEKGKLKDNLPFGNIIYGNPEIMSDRILLDSTKTMIAQKTSNPLGYCYYEWKNKKHSKTYEEIQFPKLKFKTIIFYSDSGSAIEQQTECPLPFLITYSKNRWQTVDRIRIQLNQKEADSLIKTYNFPKDKMFFGTKFWTEISFYDNGEIKSIGTVITGMNEPEANKYRIGTWDFYNLKGELEKKETFTTIKKINE